jgi:uncharacterized protein YigE (DUF2233 family)
MIRRRVPPIILVLLFVALSACSSRSDLLPPTRLVPTLFPTAVATVPAADPLPVTAQPSDSSWREGAAGIASRAFVVAPPDEREPFPVTVVRLDPAQVRLRVGYDPNEPRLLSSWFEQRRPLLAVNGGFFTESYATTALLISDGVASGTSYQGFGGMLVVGPDEAVSLWALRDTPYDPAVPIAHGLQSFPMLVFPGGVAAPLDEDGRRARRTAVALDRDGHVLFVVSPTSSFTLRELAAWLVTSDLGVDRALNLDGGSSTGLFLSAGQLSEQIDSFGPLPIVVFAEPR